MRVLVTGSHGTLGIPLVRELRRRDHDVYGCDLAHDPNQLGFGLRTDVHKPHYIRCDITEFRQLERLFAAIGGFDLVYHLAAEYGRWNGEDYYEQLWRTNVIGTKHILRLQEQYQFRLVHFSSSEIYGNNIVDMHEDAPMQQPTRQMNDYALSKWVNEMQILNSAQQFHTESVRVRLSNVYGPGEHYSPYRSVNCRFMYCALHNLPWIVFRGHHRTSTYVDDCIHTLANIATHFHPGQVYNISSAAYHSIEMLSDLVLKLTGADPGLVAYQDATETMTIHDKRVDHTRAMHDLDHRDTVSLEEGMRRTMEWMRQCTTPATTAPVNMPVTI